MNNPPPLSPFRDSGSMDESRFGVWIVQDGRFCHVNAAMAAMFGYSPEEMKNRIGFSELVIPEDREVLCRHLDGNSAPEVLEPASIRCVRRDGRIFPAMVWGTAGRHDGEPVSNGTLVEIPGRLEMERELEASRDLLQRYLQAIDDIGMGLFVVDGAYRIRDMNSTLRAWYGDQRGKICYRAVAGRKSPCGYCRLREVVEEGRTIKYQPTTPDGRTFDIVAVPLTDPDGSVCKMEIIRDITEQEEAKAELVRANRRLEEALARAEELAETAEAASQAKSVFLSNMSHELRTPLNVILGYTQLFIADSSLGPQQQSGIRTMHQAGHHLLQLINEILDLSKIEAGKMELVPTEIRLAEFLREIEEIFRPKAERKGVSFRCELLENTPAYVVVDELRLRQVILNLLSNAIKFTARGYCLLSIRVQPRTGQRAVMSVTVEDSGSGIAPDMQEKIFEPFQQGGERLLYSQGSGLGLSISRKLVGLLGGELLLVSPVHQDPPAGQGPGSRFSFSMEVELKNRAAAQEMGMRIVTGYEKDGGGKKKILIVDNSSANRAVLADTLKGCDFLVAEAACGEEVLAQCRRFGPDAILMDLRMPDEDGLALTERLRSHREFSDIPVIAISATPADSILLEEYELADLFAGYIVKPFVVSELLEVLAAQLDICLLYREDRGADHEEERFTCPPAPVLEELLALVQVGDITGITTKIRALAGDQSGTYGRFVEKVGSLAEEFQLGLIEQFIEECRKDHG